MTSPSIHIAAALRPWTFAPNEVIRPKALAQTLAWAATGSVFLVGCSSASPGSISVAPPANAAPPSAAQAGLAAVTIDEAAILSTYRSFWREVTPISMLSESQRATSLARLAADPALQSLLAGINKTHAEGRVLFGTPTIQPHLSSLSQEAGVAVVQDCQDARQAGAKVGSTGAIVTVGSARTAVVSTLHRQADGVWRVVFVSFPASSC